MRNWVNQALKQGLIVPVRKLVDWASNLILVAKYNPDTPKDSPPDGIRVCGDFVKVNQQIE